MRFPGFEEEWETKKLGEVATNVMYGMNAAATNYDGENQYIRITDIDEQTRLFCPNPLSSPDGELDNKYLLHKGDILFARTGASVGKSYLYNDKDGKVYFAGFLIRLNVRAEDPYFIFSQTLTEKYQRWVVTMSMRSGQPGINAEEYKLLPIVTPSIQEQEKISSFLLLIDERIQAQNKIIEELEQLIKGLCQKLFHNRNNKDWSEQSIEDVLEERKEVNTDNYTVHSVSVSKGVINQIEYLGRSFAAKDTKNYNVVHYGDIVYTKSPTGEFPYGIIKQSFIKERVAVSPLYGVFRAKSFYMANILHFYFSNPINVQNYLQSIIQKGAKNTISITNQSFLKKRLYLPIDEKEIKKISSLLSAIESKKTVEMNILERLKNQKKHFLQQMFI
ncbi:restriction endonuclease subunit S [Myroides odoratimimus]|uniref:restriction endonuclease subunit S n=1 Tax=Myroides odoratimimus TaxID=76832 RepID=UPI002578DD81|nr:restriction endonuclease subunit S [Myroides odoratimimus]